MHALIFESAKEHIELYLKSNVENALTCFENLTSHEIRFLLFHFASFSMRQGSKFLKISSEFINIRTIKLCFKQLYGLKAIVTHPRFLYFVHTSSSNVFRASKRYFRAIFYISIGDASFICRMACKWSLGSDLNLV